jgi:hypothetical protein
MGCGRELAGLGEQVALAMDVECRLRQNSHQRRMQVVVDDQRRHRRDHRSVAIGHVAGAHVMDPASALAFGNSPGPANDGRLPSVARPAVRSAALARERVR